MCQSHWSAQYRSRSPGQGICQVSTSRRSLYKVWWLKALQLRTYEKVDVKGVKVNGARNIGQGHPVKVLVESVH